MNSIGILLCHHNSLSVVLKVKLTDCSAHSVLSVKAVMVTAY